MGLEQSTLSGPRIARLTTNSGFDCNQSRLFNFTEAPILDDGYSYTPNDDYITVDEHSVYEVHMNCRFTSSVERAVPGFFLYKNRTASGTGGTKLGTCGRMGYMRNADTHNTSSVDFAWVGELAAGDTLAVQNTVEGASGTVTVDHDATTMLIKTLDVEGL